MSIHAFFADIQRQLVQKKNNTISSILYLITKGNVLSKVIFWKFSAQDRPTTKVHAAPGGGSSLDFLFGGGGGGAGAGAGAGGAGGGK